jgi:hypothetical protein
MQLQLDKFAGTRSIHINGKNADLYILVDNSESGKFIAKADQGADLYVPTKLADIQASEMRSRITTGGGLIIITPGEYEKHEVFVSTHKNSTSAAVTDVIEAEVDKVRIAYISSDIELNKEILESLGVIHVLILEVVDNFEKQLKVIGQIDPQLLVPIASEGLAKDRFDKFISDLGVKFEEINKYKAKSTDFANEEYVMQGILLN